MGMAMWDANVDVDTDADRDGNADDIFPFWLHTACVIKCLFFAQ